MVKENKSTICPKFEKTFTLLGKRWTGLIIRMLMDDCCRFGDLAHRIPGISARMLAERLKELEQEAIIRRIVIPDMPVKIEYKLTDKGQSLARALDPLQEWAESWIKQEV